MLVCEADVRCISALHATRYTPALLHAHGLVAAGANQPININTIVSNQARRPAELKHISKRRKRN